MKSNSKSISLNPISLIIATCKYWRLNVWRIIFLTAIVAIPGSVVRVLQFDSVNDASIVASVAGLYLSVALTWVFFHESDLKKYRVPTLYVRSSSRFLPFLLTSIYFALIAMPVMLGIMIIILALSTQIPMYYTYIGGLFSLAAMYFVVRFSLATTFVVQNELSSFNAMRLSWEVSAKNSIKLAFAWGSIILLIILASGLLLSGAEQITFLRENLYAQVLLNGLLLTFFLPLFIGYGVQIVKRLEK